MTLATLLRFVLTELVLSATPGPAVFLVVSQGMKAGFQDSLRGTLGVMTGELIFFVLSALGLGALLLASQTVFTAVKWLGALYLVYLGLRMVVESFKKTNADAETVGETPHLTLYHQGLVTQLANPKAILFFTSLLPQFINPGVPGDGAVCRAGARLHHGSGECAPRLRLACRKGRALA